MHGREALALAVDERDRHNDIDAGDPHLAEQAGLKLVAYGRPEQQRHAEALLRGALHRLGVAELEDHVAIVDARRAQPALDEGPADEALRSLDEREAAKLLR